MQAAEGCGCLHNRCVLSCSEALSGIHAEQVCSTKQGFAACVRARWPQVAKAIGLRDTTLKQVRAA